MATAPQTKGNVAGQDTIAPLHDYHIVLSNGEERNVKGAGAYLHDGALLFKTHQGAHAVCYAAGQWTMYELERQDDRG